jgi:hypothetical protein
LSHYAPEEDEEKGLWNPSSKERGHSAKGEGHGTMEDEM